MVDKAKRSVWFDDIAEIGHVFEVEFRKEKVAIKRSLQVGIDVYQLAKLRMLRFYYHCLHYFIEIWGSHTKRSKERSGRRVLKSWKRQRRIGSHETNRTPDLSKLEFEGAPGITLCSKCY